MSFDKSPILDNLIAELSSPLRLLSDTAWDKLEEIRLRIMQPVYLRFADCELSLAAAVELCRVDEPALIGGMASDSHAETVMTEMPDDELIMTAERLARMVQLISKSSLYAFNEELRQGFLTLPGGHRVGLAGECVSVDGRISTIKNISSINIRLARPVPGAATCLLPYLLEPAVGLHHCLIVSPPRVGKTTMLRDLIRLFADGLVGLPPLNVGVADERRELAAVFQGVPQLPIGSRSDVVSGCPKAAGLELLLRSLSPDLVVTDELGRADDAVAVREAINSGVRVLASAHGACYAELLERPVLRDLLLDGCFERVIVLERAAGQPRIREVFDAAGERLA